MKIAVFYHCKLNGDGIPDENHALWVMDCQMAMLKRSGLADAANEIHLCVNGATEQGLIALGCCRKKATLHINGTHARSELPSLVHLRNWLKPGWFVFYHHIKGVTKPNNALWDNWRSCMQRACVLNWKRCVGELQRGIESCGAHWLTPQQYGGSVKSPFWGGNFWWASSDFLMTLPPVKPNADTRDDFYIAESWIGTGPRPPTVTDFAPHWPSLDACA